jgi:hypothetical protein
MVVNRDKFTTVIVSPGYGAGWSTWNESEDMFDIAIADMLIAGDLEGAINCAEENEKYAGGLEDAEVVVIPKGKEFIIREYDGSEWIEYKDEIEWEIA